MNTTGKQIEVAFNPFRDGELFATVPTTASQKEIWGSLEIDPDANLCYNESIRINLKGPLDTEILEKAINETVARRDALRASFSPRGKDFMVGVHRPRELEISDYTSYNEGEQKALIAKKIKEATNYRFDLNAGPLFIFELVKLNHEEHILFLTGHHLICDGWSMALIVSDISKLYESIKVGLGTNLGDEVPRFFEYALNQQESTVPDYWLKEFQDLPKPLELPLDYERPKFRSYNSKRIDYKIRPEVVKKAKIRASKARKSFYQYFLTNFAVLLNQLSSQDDIVMGISSAGQSFDNQENLVGHLVHLLPIRLRVKKNQTFKELLDQTKTKMLDAFDHQQVTYGQILQELKVARDPARIPLVNVIFNVDQQYEGQGMEFKGIDAHYESNPRHFENFEIFINATILGNNCVLECQYNDSLFKEESIRSWLTQFEKQLETFNQNIDALVGNGEFTAKPVVKEIEPTISPKKDISVSSEWLTNARQLWESALEVEGIPEGANFFTIGGHSLLGVDVCHEAFEKFGIKVSLKDLIQGPSLMDFANLLEKKHGVVSGNKKLKKLDLFTHSLSCSQKEVWFWEQTNPGTSVYHLPSAIKISKNTEHNQLHKAFLSIFKNHPSLRTKFLKNANQEVVSMEEVVGAFNLELRSASLKALPDILAGMAKEPFDLTTAPLLKAVLFDCGEDGKVLFTMFHHIVFDGWSFDIFFRDLDLAYKGLDLEKEELEYIDFCAWQSDYIKEGTFKNDLELWKEKLKGPLPLLDLPTDYPRPDKVNPEAEEVCFEIPEQLKSKLFKFSESNGVSMFSVFMGCFNQALMDYSKTDEVVVGIPVRGRNSTKLLNTIGYFVNASAIRTKRAETPRQSFEAVQSEVGLALSHQDVPFSEIVRSLNLKENPGRTAVYQAFFSFQDVSNRKAVFNGSEYSQINVSSPHASTDLNMWVKSSKKKIEGGIAFRKDLFKKETVEYFYSYLVDLLEFSVGSDNKWDLFSSPSVKEKIDGINATEAKDQTICNFVDLIDEVAFNRPQKVAIIGDDRQLTYSDLQKMSDAIAVDLINDGAAVGDLIGLSCERGAMMMVGLLGILKAGCTYVPLDPSFPLDRLEYMIKDSGTKKLLVSDSNADLFDSSDVKVKRISNIDFTKTLNERPTVTPDLAAYVIYTSGSTGKPKGVEVLRSSLNNFLLSMRKTPGITANDTLLAVTTLSFDIAALELYLPLISGSQLVIASKEATMDGDELVQLTRAHKVTVMQATPSTWRLMLANGWSGGNNFKALCGGEALPKDLAHKLCIHVGELWNMYGPTETTIWSTCKQVHETDEVISIGRPIDNTKVYILDDNKKLLPLGVSGHLYIAGQGLAAGYFKKPELTAEKFVADTISCEGLMYETGDIARILPNGEVECLGRSDNQVKLRGFRIELGEIEAAIAEEENIKEAVVLITPNKTGEPTLVAYITVEDKELHNQFELQANISNALPSYMIPAVFIVLDQMPKTLNEKIDRKALSSLSLNKAVKQTSTVKQEMVKKEKVNSSSIDTFKSIWMQTIGVTSCSEDDHFFDVGGHSLLAVDLFRELETKLNIDLPLSTLITNPTLGELIRVAFPDSDFEHVTEETGNANQQLFVPEICSSIVPIRAKGSKTPIFIFHSVGGNVINYMKVGPHCGEHPLFGVQAFGVDGKSSIIKGIPEMAQRYLDEIRLVQPKGPYILAGGSMGGLIAYEVGRLLLEQGEKIGPIIMFDTFGPGLKLKKIKATKRNFLETHKFGVQWRLKKLKVKIQSMILNTLGLPIPHSIRHFNVEVNNYESLWSYKAGVLQGDIVLMRAPLGEDDCYKEPEMGWREVVKGNIDIYYVDGAHYHFIESNEFPKVFKDVLTRI